VPSVRRRTAIDWARMDCVISCADPVSIECADFNMYTPTVEFFEMKEFVVIRVFSILPFIIQFYLIGADNIQLEISSHIIANSRQGWENTKHLLPLQP